MSRRRRIGFAWLAIALGMLPLVAIEVGCRLKGFGGYPAFLREAARLPDGSTLCLVEPAASKPYFFANPERPGYADQSHFVMPKPPGVVRVFLFGESAAKGYPQPPNLAMSAFLQAMLGDLYPERTIEVINLGTTAVASFPIRAMVGDAIAHDPDLLVFYVGNNEFFGAYGTASIHGAGGVPPAVQVGLRELRGLASVQALYAALQAPQATDKTLMEQVIGQTVISADSSLRVAAARNLKTNLMAMLDQARRHGVPAVVCTTASNESGMAPIGVDVADASLDRVLPDLERVLETAPGDALESLRALVEDHPRHARLRFLLGRACAGVGDSAAARAAFLAARDLDTMPWRPVSVTEQAIRDAASARGAVLCDVARAFREGSPDGATGWDLLDDHVHLALRGQAEAARLMAEAIATGVLAVKSLPRLDARAVRNLPGWEVYADRLGRNRHDQYRVDHTLRVLFSVPFMARNNPGARDRFVAKARDAEAGMDAAMLDVVRQWQTSAPHAGGLRPITGMVARELLRRREMEDACALYRIARTQVPAYTSWSLEYAYFELVCRESLEGSLGDEERRIAREAIERGRVLLANGFTGSGMTERHVGRLHQLLGEFEASVPYLRAARGALIGTDRVACDQALVLSYVRTRRLDEAAAIVREGLEHAGPYEAAYRQMDAFILRER
jgi:lysophospholipase L1-like esterase